MATFDHDALWAKSQRFVGLAVAARNELRFDEFGFWCAVSLEMLGKAMLARVHPSLVADARHIESLFMACGKTVRPEQVSRSIGAAEVFQRLKLLSPTQFDGTHNEFCLRMAERRN